MATLLSKSVSNALTSGPRIACHRTPLPKGLGKENKLRPSNYPVYDHSKCCKEGRSEVVRTVTLITLLSAIFEIHFRQ